MVHARIAPHVSHQLHSSQGGFRWGADALVGSLVNVLQMWSTSHTFVAFVYIQKAFDTSWVEATLVRLFNAGVTGRMWKLIANFLRQTRSQVRLGTDLSEPWDDSGIAQGRVLSPLLFNLLIDGLAVALHRASPGVSLTRNSDFRFVGQLYADDLALTAECESDLQTALDVVSAWGFQYRFNFGIGYQISGHGLWPEEECAKLLRHAGRPGVASGSHVQVLGRGPFTHQASLGLGQPALRTVCVMVPFRASAPPRCLLNFHDVRAA